MGRITVLVVRTTMATLLVLLPLVAARQASAAASQLTHNSANSPGSTKWGGNWGVTGGKYGEFVCKTCHENQRINIKLVKPTIPTYIGISTTTPKTVRFMNVTGFGNDNEVRTASNRICEVCHTQTAVHRYNNSGQTEANHQNANQTDCTTCHTHRQAFIATGNHTINLNPNTNPYTGPDTCLRCHATSKTGSNTVTDLYDSVHFQLRTLNADVDLPGGGSHGMLDRACGLPGTTAMAGNWAGTAVSPINGTTYDDGCGKCHITYKMPYRYPTVADAKADFNCLICHAKVYAKEWDDPAIQAIYGTNPENHDRKVITLADGSKSWSQDRSTKTAQTAGDRVTVKACLRCHEHGLDGYKRSTPYTAENDAHAERNMLCTDCHTTSQHKMARGNYVTDGMANEMPNSPVTCTGSCHTALPHSGSTASDLNKHSTNLSCEACHIPTLNNEHGSDIQKRAWAPFTLNPMTGVWDATPVMTNAEYPGFYDAHTIYYPAGTTPTIRWFNGKASMLAQPYGDYANRASEGGTSKLYAFREFQNGMLFDAGWLPTAATYQNPNLDHVNQTAPYSMKYFFNANWDKFKQFGFADAATYPTAQAYWTARPDMAYQMNNFPMMLQFNRTIFLSEAGQKIGNPSPGPQSAATYPGVAKAINSGMGSIAIDMGYAPQGTDPIVAGQGMWSGQFFGMWVPPNMDPQSPFMGEIDSFITMSHGIKGTTALNTIASQKYNGDICSSCHYTGAEYAAGSPLAKRIDFTKLGFTNKDATGLVDARYDRPAPDHNNIFTASNPFNGPNTCLGCHETSKVGSSTSTDLYNSVHFQLRTNNSDMDIPGGGSHGMLDRACGLPGTTAMAGNWAGTAVSPINGATYDDGCGKCHITTKMPYRYQGVAEAKADFDCLICHAKVYGKEWEDPAIQAVYGTNPENHDHKVITLIDGSKAWSQDRSTKTAKTVGTKITVKACLRCHEHGLDGYKRSTPYTAENDVHAERQMLCTDCHTTSQHKIARGNFVTDGMANEMPNSPVTCTGTCHTAAPHNASNAATLNRHSTNLSCEACHIPTLNNEHGNDIHKRAWAPFTLNPMTGVWDTTPVMTNAEYPGYYDAYTTYYPAGTTPTIRWFNGKASMLAQPYGDYANRASEGGASKLYAFREFVNGMLFDAGWLAQSATYQNPNLDHVNQTAPYSMKYFFNANWDKFKAFGFADAAAYPTAQAYWTARPDMAYQMNNFPMMLQFNRAIFLSEAGQKIGNPSPGPQSAATYPGVAKAINSGMGSMAIDMGYAPPGTDPIVAGQAMWSGQFFGMWVPPNMDPQSPFMGEINSFITMSHGIKGTTALNTIASQKYNGDICSSCHYTGAEYAAGSPLAKRIDFTKLGYPGQGPITDPMYSPANCVNCHPLATLLTSGAHGKHISTAPRFYNMTGNHSAAGVYDFGCANCHPLDLANHNNGALNVTLNKVNSGTGGAVGRLRALNSATTDGLAPVNGPSGIFGTTRVSVKCSASYCHSNGYAANLQFAQSPDWYGPAYVGDKCAMCHGNAPNNGGKAGSAAHSAHQIGIHYNSIFNGKSGFLPAASLTRQDAGHGYGWSTTISCNTCHNDTVTTGFNAANQTCATANCHGSGGVYTTTYAAIANTTRHVNGMADLKFVATTFKSKAQLRDGSFDSYTAAGQGGWSRNRGYKNYSTSYDVTKQTLQLGTTWTKDATTTTCTTACHANKQVLWNSTTVNCNSCHTRL